MIDDEIGFTVDERFDPSLAEKAAEGKPEKLKGEVTSFDVAANGFKLKLAKGGESEIVTNSTTQFKKGKDDSNFETVVTVGAKVDVSVLGGVAISVVVKK